GPHHDCRRPHRLFGSGPMKPNRRKQKLLPLPSVLCLLSSALRPLPSVLWPLPSVLRRLPSVLRPLFSPLSPVKSSSRADLLGHLGLSLKQDPQLLRLNRVRHLRTP